MPERPTSLLARLANRFDLEAWPTFVCIYGPIVHRYAIEHGLGEQAARDVVAGWLLEVRTYAHRHPDWPTFQRWVRAIADDEIRLREIDPAETPAEDPSWSGRFELISAEEILRHVVHEDCPRRFSERDLTVFASLCFERSAVQRIARECNLSPADVGAITREVMGFLVESMFAVYGLDPDVFIVGRRGSTSGDASDDHCS